MANSPFVVIGDRVAQPGSSDTCVADSDVWRTTVNVRPVTARNCRQLCHINTSYHSAFTDKGIRKCHFSAPGRTHRQALAAAAAKVIHTQ
jgi:hypothetical protein